MHTTIASLHARHAFYLQRAGCPQWMRAGVLCPPEEAVRMAGSEAIGGEMSITTVDYLTTTMVGAPGLEGALKAHREGNVEDNDKHK